MGEFSAPPLPPKCPLLLLSQPCESLQPWTQTRALKSSLYASTGGWIIHQLAGAHPGFSPYLQCGLRNITSLSVLQFLSRKVNWGIS